MILKIVRDGIEFKKEDISLKNTDNVFYTCDKCGIEVSKQVISLKKHKPILYLCPKCMAKNTTMKKYGVEFHSQSEEAKKSKRETCLRQYGVTNNFQAKEVKEKIKQTNLEKYGVENPAQSVFLKEKTKQTNLKKYGVENPFQAKEIKEKIKQTNLEKYGVENPQKNEEIRERTYIAFKEMNYKKLLSKVEFGFNLNTSLESYLSFDVHNKPFSLSCKKCGTSIDFFNNSGDAKIPRCHICHGEPSGGSFEEDGFFNFIQSLSNKEIIRNSRKILGNGAEIDIYIPELKLGFEYNGLYWHSEINGGKGKYYHVNKQQIANELEIELFFVNSDEWLSHKKPIIQSIIKSKFGIFDNKIFARKCEIKEVSSVTAKDFLFYNHIQGAINASVKIGLYYNNELVSLITLGKNRFSKEYEWELYRYCNKLNYQIIGGFSKMFSYFIKNYNPSSIITFSDKRLFNKNTYSSSGFTQLEDISPNYYYTKSFWVLENRMKYQKHKLPLLLEKFDQNLTEWENMQMNGYDRMWDCGNRKFVWRTAR